MAFLSVVLPRGDAWVVFLLFLPTFFPQLLALLQPNLHPAVWRALLFLLPPQTALQEVYRALLEGETAWGAAAFAAGVRGGVVGGGGGDPQAAGVAVKRFTRGAAWGPRQRRPGHRPGCDGTPDDEDR